MRHVPNPQPRRRHTLPRRRRAAVLERQVAVRTHTSYVPAERPHLLSTLAHTRLAIDEPSHATPFGTQTSPHNHVRGMVGPLGHYVEHLGGNRSHTFAHTPLARTSRFELVNAAPPPKASPWTLGES